MSVKSVVAKVDKVVDKIEKDTQAISYNNLNAKWNSYKNNNYLSDGLKQKIQEDLNKLKDLVDVTKEERNNEEIAKLIASLTAIIDGNDSTMGLADRVKCLEELEKYDNHLTNINTFYDKLTRG